MRLGVIGAMVWDTIHGRDAAMSAPPTEEWGGIAYSLSALEATLPPNWEIVPLIKVGRDLAPAANDFLRGLTRRSAAARFIEVPEPNNRVVLLYESAERRTERLSGGVPGWRWSELGPMVQDLDALYVNLIAGWELDLETAQHLRRGFSGPIYVDMHSAFLGVAGDGTRTPRPLKDIEAWFACFDAVQINEEEMAQIGGAPMEVAARALGQGVRLFLVTLGAGGVVYFTQDPFTFLPRPSQPSRGPIRTARLRAEPTDGDPTGCGDVFGASLTARLLSGASVDDALAAANRMAGRNVTFKGASGLHRHLKGELARA
jgi:hypothetical protein